MKKNNSFSVDDIHKVREEIYEKTKDLSSNELVNYINDKADEIREKIKRNTKEKLAV